MKRKQTFALVSTSALAAGMAQGAVTYSGIINTQVPADPTAPARGADFDLNQDGLNDFYLGFDGFGTSNPQKPYLQGYAVTSPGSTARARSYFDAGRNKTTYGLPITQFGTMIDGNYLEPNLTTGYDYFYQNGDGPYVGDWPKGARTEGYVGLELYDASTSTTNFGWAHVIYDGTTPTNSLTLVDFGYETSAGVGIVAGSTNTLGAPDIYVPPQSQAVAWAARVQLGVVALGNPAPSYQWKAGPVGSGVYTNLSDGGIISGSSTANLTLNGITAANLLDYVVVVNNSLGSVTSPLARLTQATPVATPTPQVLYGGLTARFRIDAGSGFSGSYRWRQNGVNLSDGGRISGSTTPNLVLNNLQVSDSGSYDVVLTVGTASVTSSAASLTVQPISSESIYEAAVLAARPVAYYRLNETGDPGSGTLPVYDNAGAYNGLYGKDVTNGVAGPRPTDGFPGFAADNRATQFPTNDYLGRISLAPWSLSTDVATMAAWVNPADSIQPANAGVIGAGTTNGSQAGIRYYFQANSGSGIFDLGYAWPEGTDASFFWDSFIAPPPNQWSFVAVTITPSNATLYIFNPSGVSTAISDGTASGPFSPFTNHVLGFVTPEYIGTDPSDAAGKNNFNGMIDEVAFWSRAMGSNELQALYDAALGILPPVDLQISQLGSNVQLSWGTLGQLLEAPTVSGPWSTNSLASSPYIVAPTGGAKFYRVLVH